MAGLFSSGEQDMLGNIVQGRQQANQALGSPYGKYGGIVQAGAALADVGADAMFGGKTGAADPRMQQANDVKNIFAQVAMEVGNTSSADFYEKLSQALSAQYPEQAQKAADKANELKPKDNSTELLKNFTAASVAKYKQSGNLSDLVRVVDDKGDGTQVVEVNGKEVLINKATGETINVLGDARPVPAGPTIVNKPSVQETAEQKEFGANLAKTYNKIAETADTSSKTKVALETQLNSLNKGFETGFGTEAIAAAASVLGTLGVKDAEKFATNAQVFKAAASSAILQKQLEQKGPQTQSDANMIRETGAKLGNTKEANIFLAKVGIAQANRDRARQKFYSKWRSKNKTFDGAEEAWLEEEGSKSLFDSPELKEYKKTDSAEQARMVAKLKSKPQYSNLTDDQAIRALRNAGKIK